MLTNFGLLDIVIDATTGRAKRARKDVGMNSAVAPRRQQVAPPAGPHYKSKLEARYAQHLDALRFAGAIACWYYEPMNFRLPGKRNFYKPDFLVVAGDGLTFVDTKGVNKSDERSLVKIKTAAGLHCWARFVQVRRDKGHWTERTIEGGQV